MAFNFISIALLSFVITALFSPLFIGFLYKFNIRRISKAELDEKIPDRALKFGTPIMGGFIIVFSVLILSTIFLLKWDAYIPFITILILGAFFGAIDEYLNTIGRKGFSYAVRDSVDLFISKSKILWEIYKIILKPWDLFKEAFRAMGSSQRGLKSHEKFIMHIIVALIGSYWLYTTKGYNFFWIPFFGDITVGVFYIPILTFIALGFASAFGITDGMDGLSAGLHSSAFLALGVLALILGYTDLAIFCALIFGSELAFLYFNIHPARVEMSDVGTLPLGVLFTFIAAYMHREFAALIIGALFILEILSSFIQVWSVKLRGKRVFLIAPIHHHFEKMGWHETKVTMRFWLFGALFSLFGLMIGLI